MREDIKTFSISGMGCSAGVIGIDIVRSLLRSHSKSYAVVISTEIVSTGWYTGRDHRKLLLNCFFRMGSSAVLLTNRKEAKKRSKYKLMHLLRTQRPLDDRAYRSAIREEDTEGSTGFSIEHNLLHVSAESHRANLVPLGIAILPAHQKLRYGMLYLWKSLTKASSEKRNLEPEFGSAIQHYCMPTSGRAMIEEMGRGLRLGERNMEAALMTFKRFGNQSSASMWYQLAYVEVKERVRKRDRVRQLGMRSGPKCNTVVWKRLKRLVAEAEKGPWSDCIHQYPVVKDGDGRDL